jgi:aryl-alcohol dehydrogenase-like predicted oxidoreductase
VSAFTSPLTVVDALSAVAASAAAVYMAYYVYGWMRKAPDIASPLPSVS